MVILNRVDDDVFIDFNWEIDAQIPAGIYAVRDLWAAQDIGLMSPNYSGLLEKHATWVFKLTLLKEDETEAPPSSSNFLTLSFALLFINMNLLL